MSVVQDAKVQEAVTGATPGHVVPFDRTDRTQPSDRTDRTDRTQPSDRTDRTQLFDRSQPLDRAVPGAVPGDCAVPDDQVVAVWRELSACHAKACAALERELGERHGLGVSEYEVLARLAECSEHKHRSQDLAEAVSLSQSALSRLVDRLARHGLVQRFTCDMDRRGIFVQLTEAGQQRYAEATPTHRSILCRTIPDRFLEAR